jgi:hypothetical protein
LLACSLAAAVIALSACGSDDDDGEAFSAAELSSSLPAANDLGLDQQGELEVDDGADLVNAVDGLVIGGTTDGNELGAKIDDAGFQGAVGEDLGESDLNVRIRAVQFDSAEGAGEAQKLLHHEDLQTPCPDACIVTPLEYELDDIPDSTAVHHVPNRSNLPPGQVKVEAHHAEFPVGPRLYVVQVDGKPSPTFTADFDKLMGTVYESASSAE